MPKPRTLRDEMARAIQLGIPELQPSSLRPPEAEPTDERLEHAAELLRNGATVREVAEMTGLTTYLVGVVAECVAANWRFEPSAGEFPTVFQVEHGHV